MLSDGSSRVQGWNEVSSSSSPPFSFKMSAFSHAKLRLDVCPRVNNQPLVKLHKHYKSTLHKYWWTSYHQAVDYPFFSFSKHISGLHTAFWSQDALPSETAWHYCSQCLTPSPLASWYQFTLLGEQGHQSISSLSCPELLVRKSVASGIELATLRSPGRSLNHTTTGPPTDIGANFGGPGKALTYGYNYKY